MYNVELGRWRSKNLVLVGLTDIDRLVVSQIADVLAVVAVVVALASQILCSWI